MNTNTSRPCILQYLVLVAYAILVTLSPSIHFIPYIEFHDCQRILQLVLLSLVLVNSISFWQNKNTSILVNKKVYLVSTLILGLAAISASASVKLRYAVIEISIFIALFYLARFIALQFQNDKEVFIKQLSYVLWASILLYMLSFYVGYITAIAFKKPLSWPYPFFGFSNIRFFQQYQLGALGLICVPLLAFNLEKKLRIFLHIALVFWWVLLFYAASRGSSIAWLIAILATAVVYRREARSFLRIQLTSTMAGFATYIFLFKIIPIWTTSIGGATVITGNIFRVTTHDRLYLWNGAYEMIKNSPFFGVGPMQYPFHISFGTYPHNSLLLLASEWGLIATFIILSTAAYTFYSWFKRYNLVQLQKLPILDKNLTIVLFFSIVANAAYSLVSGVIVIPISQVLFFTIIGLMIGQYAIGRSSENNKIEKIKSPAFQSIFALITLVAICWSTFPELKRGITSYGRDIGINDRPFALESGTINPRIWMQQRPIKQRENMHN